MAKEKGLLNLLFNRKKVADLHERAQQGSSNEGYEGCRVDCGATPRDYYYATLATKISVRRPGVINALPLPRGLRGYAPWLLYAVIATKILGALPQFSAPALGQRPKNLN